MTALRVCLFILLASLTGAHCCIAALIFHIYEDFKGSNMDTASSWAIFALVWVCLEALILAVAALATLFRFFDRRAPSAGYRSGLSSGIILFVCVVLHAIAATKAWEWWWHFQKSGPVSLARDCGILAVWMAIVLGLYAMVSVVCLASFLPLRDGTGINA
jgi:hypothetical protein